MKTTAINLDGIYQTAVNVSAIVGFGGANRRGDVMLIQGLFNYIAKIMPDAVGLGGEYKVPEITGEMDTDTYSAISEFQIINAQSLLMKQFDGRIHPASYANRRLHTSNGKRFMCITYLHIMAMNSALFQGHLDYIQELANLNSELKRYIDMGMIGVDA